MAIKETNERIVITLKKDQIKWLKKFCKEHHTTPSLFIKYLLSKKAEELYTYLQLKQGDDEQLKELIRIAKTPWID